MGAQVLARRQRSPVRLSNSSVCSHHHCGWVSETKADLEGGVVRNIVQFARKPLLQRGIPMVRKFASGANCW
jgi:hypothetical protein